MLTEQAPILLVDDSSENLLALEAVLSHLGQTVIRASSGREALKQVLKYNFAAILMDAHMPDMDGFETARIIRMRDQSRYTPIIFLTAYYKDEAKMSEAYSLGAVDYIAKPVDTDILQSKVKVFIDLFTKSIHAQRLQHELEKRKQAENELKQVNKRIQLILSSAGEGIYGLNGQGKITFANPAAAAILGMEVEELIQQSVNIMLPLPAANDLSNAWHKTPIFQALNEKTSLSVYDTYFRKKNGEMIPVEYTVTPSHPKKRYKDLSLIIVFKDTSERKRAEHLNQLHQRQLALAHVAKLSTMEEMASALAHELNQPLAAIINYTQGTVNRLNKKNIQVDELRKVMQLTVQQAERAGMIIHRIKNFVRKGRLYCEPKEMNDLISSTVDLVRDDLKKANVSVLFHLAEQLPLAYVDSVQLTQVILNLINNALEAMQDPEVSERKLTIYSKVQESNIQISIKDSGVGFHPETEDKLFEMYFTTKSEGMGMGLAICRSVIEAHGGHLSAINNPEGGSMFTIVLPVMEERCYVE